MPLKRLGGFLHFQLLYSLCCSIYMHTHVRMPEEHIVTTCEIHINYVLHIVSIYIYISQGPICTYVYIILIVLCTQSSRPVCIHVHFNRTPDPIISIRDLCTCCIYSYWISDYYILILDIRLLYTHIRYQIIIYSY